VTRFHRQTRSKSSSLVRKKASLPLTPPASVRVLPCPPGLGLRESESSAEAECYAASAPAFRGGSADSDWSGLWTLYQLACRGGDHESDAADGVPLLQGLAGSGQRSCNAPSNVGGTLSIWAFRVQGSNFHLFGKTSEKLKQFVGMFILYEGRCLLMEISINWYRDQLIQRLQATFQIQRLQATL
jgi:hypothetical protein